MKQIASKAECHKKKRVWKNVSFVNSKGKQVSFYKCEAKKASKRRLKSACHQICRVVGSKRSPLKYSRFVGKMRKITV